MCKTRNQGSMRGVRDLNFDHVSSRRAMVSK